MKSSYFRNHRQAARAKLVMLLVLFAGVLTLVVVLPATASGAASQVLDEVARACLTGNVSNCKVPTEGPRTSEDRARRFSTPVVIDEGLLHLAGHFGGSGGHNADLPYAWGDAAMIFDVADEILLTMNIICSPPAGAQ